MLRTREELTELLRISEENLRKCRSANRRLKALMTKIKKAEGQRKSVRRNAQK